MLDQVQAQGQTKLLAEPPLRLHHHAYAVKDQEVDRRFIEDIPGFLWSPLGASACSGRRLAAR